MRKQENLVTVQRGRLSRFNDKKTGREEVEGGGWEGSNFLNCILKCGESPGAGPALGRGEVGGRLRRQIFGAAF